MTRIANPARGEVELKIGDDTFILDPSMENLVKWQVIAKFQGAPALMQAVLVLDLKVIISAIQAMAMSGPVEKAHTIPGYLYMRALGEIQKALIFCLEGPKVPDAGNAPGATAESPT